jgi:starch phosphorylase
MFDPSDPVHSRELDYNDPVLPPASTETVAYFSMEIALAHDIPTYSGGLGILAGDTLRSAADLSVPMVAVTLLHRYGYFHQHLDAHGIQTDSPEPWDVVGRLDPEAHVVAITIHGRPIMVRAWRFEVTGITGHILPVYLLDTDMEENDEWDRHLTDRLYGGDNHYRFCQEAVLGLGGVKLLSALGYKPAVYHMNEGHAALLTLGLLEEQLNGEPLASATPDDINAVRSQCVFTTHTPVPAGHDQFPLDQTYQVLGLERSQALEKFGCVHNGLLNMTYIALRFSRYVNGVAMQHGKISQQMFPDYPIEAITNGVHAATWVSKPFQALFDKKIPEWRYDNFYLRSAIGIDHADLLTMHREAKHTLFAEVARRTGIHLREDVLTLGFARRAATYKRAALMFHDADRLVRIAKSIGGLQILYAGKSHPKDEEGKRLIEHVYAAAARVNSDSLQVIYLENYEWDLGALMTGGVDVWVNTPLRPYEASGTSGMKAAMNGVPSLSVLDGWWIEGCVEGATGWAIEDFHTDDAESDSLYNKLELQIAPLFYHQPEQWARVMQMTIALNGSFFNTHRMLEQYLTNAYFPEHYQRQRQSLPEPVLT